MRSHYDVRFSSFIPLKYHYFSTQCPRTLMHLSHVSTSLKIPSRQKSGSWIHNHSQTAISTSLSRNRRPPKRCIRGSNKWNSDGASLGLQDCRTIGLQHLTNSYAICCMPPLPSAATYRKTKSLINTEVTG
jgi:hypothetical protein